MPLKHRLLLLPPLLRLLRKPKLPNPLRLLLLPPAHLLLLRASLLPAHLLLLRASLLPARRHLPLQLPLFLLPLLLPPRRLLM